MAPANECISCRRSKAPLNCEICGESLCKDCDQFLEEGSFAFFPSIPDELKKTHYCPLCHDEHVAPAKERYERTLEEARQVYIFFTTQKKAPEVLKRAEDPVRVVECADRDETIMRLAFLAALEGYNAVLRTEVVSEKVRNAGYQKSRWSGVGYPAFVNAEKLERQPSDF